jgi:rSAM/selenodomain-associated transferase 2
VADSTTHLTITHLTITHLTIIVPMLNETAQLPDLLSHLKKFQHTHCEVLLVDGGSNDGSTELANAAGFTLLHTSCGRASQMNFGAKQAQGNVFLFLHADTRLPLNAYDILAKAVASHKAHWGRFDVVISGESQLLNMIAWFMNTRSRLTGIATGDQAIFVTRKLFESVGGFPEQLLMEDIELSTQLKKYSHPACLTEKVITSGRRWETQGIWKTIFLMWKLRAAYWCGISVHKLAKFYV